MNATIHTPTNNLAESLDFYQRLQFQVISYESPTLLTDGKAVVEINPDRYARAGVKLYANSWGEIVESLQALTSVISTDEGYLLSGPSGIWIYLVEGSLEVEVSLSENAFGLIGNYAGVSLETIDLAKAGKLWETLGFSKTMGSAEQGWIAYANEEGFSVSLMKPMSCPHLFFNPSLTYFNGKNNPAIIQKVREANIPIAEEITYFNKEGEVDNIIIRDPGGYGFFIFND